jgi:hypothetical protein
VRTISREVAATPGLERQLTPQRLHAELLGVCASDSRAYLLGALHDATVSHAHRTVRFGQSDMRWLHVIQTLLEGMDQRSWLYREGKNRRFWILETSRRWLDSGTEATTESEIRAYVRGYFDAEGGVPRDPNVRRYIQFVQKDREDLAELRALLERLGIRCGKLHNPSSRVDPDMWRFYVTASSHREFVRSVGSWHPRKRSLLDTGCREPGW